MILTEEDSFSPETNEDTYFILGVDVVIGINFVNAFVSCC